MDPKIHESGESSDSDLLDNWTIVDTEEAYDASLYFSQSEAPSTRMSEDEVESEEQKTEAQLDDTPDSLKEDISVEEPHTDPEQIDKTPKCDTDDGVSVITDSDDELEDLDPEAPEAAVPLASSTVVAETIAPSSSSCVYDSSDLSSFSNHELPLDLGQKGKPQYLHHPNQEINYYLNAVLVVVFASVAGLAVGHFLGLQEECHIPKFNEAPKQVPVGVETWTMLNSLNHENDLLKMQLEQLQSSLTDKHQHWSQKAPAMDQNNNVNNKWPAVEAINEPVVLKETPPTPAIAELHNSTLPPAEPHSTKPQATPENFNAGGTYTDEKLEEYQTRFSKPVTEDKVPEDQPKKSKAPPVDSFYSRVESELQSIMQRVGNYGSNIVRNKHVKESLGMLATTVSDLQQRVKTLRESTAQQSSYVVENVKKSVSKMVQNVKHSAERITRNKNGGDNELGKSLQKLKMGVVNSWCHIKGKLNGNTQDCYSAYKENTTKPKYQDTKFQEPQKMYKNFNKKACYKGNCNNDYKKKAQFRENKYYQPQQGYKNYKGKDCYKGNCGADYKRAQFRAEGRMPEVNDWYSRRAYGRQENRYGYPGKQENHYGYPARPENRHLYPNNKWQRNRGR